MPILLLFLLLSGAYTVLVPLGEAPDEPAHLSYARYIAKNGLPTTLPEREAAGYRSAWPPLYHFLVAGPLAAVGDAPPTRLKAVGDTPRRLIPTNGQTIAAYLHTADEAWPWQGLPLAWHLGRLVSVLAAALAVVTTYIITRQLTTRRDLALGVAALQATLPQFLFMSSVISDDNLLVLLSSLILLTLVLYTRRSGLLGPGHGFFLGILLGLATATKYNALPLWALAVVWGVWLGWQKERRRVLRHSLIFSATLLAGAFLTGGWWVIFIWRHFNQVATQGLVPGSLAALTAGTADASLRRLGQGLTISLPPPDRWPEWFVTLFKSFWGLFGGGATIEFPGWIYWLLALLCLPAAGPYILSVSSRLISRASGSRILGTLDRRSISRVPALFLLSPLFFLPLPLLRFILTGGKIVETAQGRHLFPALPAILFGLVWGLFHLRPASRIWLAVLPVLTTGLSLYSLILIQTSYPPLIPLRTTPEAATVPDPVNVQLAEGITLVSYELGPPQAHVLPLTLVWQAGSIPGEDYVIDVTLTDATGQVTGGWLGHPVGGRYPTRAWDPGDVLRDDIPVPLLSTEAATLTLRLLDPAGRPTGEPVLVTTNLAPPVTSTPSPPLRLPPQLRADGLPSAEPFTYRSTLSFLLPRPATAPELITPDGQHLPPDKLLPGDSDGNIAHFIVKADWPTGLYQLSGTNYRLNVENRLRRFQQPPMAYPVNANFANRITLLGYDLPQRRVQPGESFPVTLHLRAEQTMGQNLIIFNHLLDREAIQRGGADRIPQNYYTTLLWVPGEIVSDLYPVPVDADAPPGVYWLDVGFYPADRPAFSLPLVINGEVVEQNSVRLGPIKVGGPPPGLTTTAPHPQRPLNISFGDQITLLGFDFVPAGNHSAQNFNLTLYWLPTTSPPADYTIFVHLLDPAGALIAQADSPPANGAYPTGLWEPGEIIVDEHHISGLPPGSYILQVGLYQPVSGARLPGTGSPDGAVTLLTFKVD